MSPPFPFFFRVILVFNKVSLQHFLFHFTMLDHILPLISRAANATAAEPEEEESQYGYTPTKYVCLILLVLFCISTLIHTAQAIRYRMLWPIPTILLAGLLEIAGWAGRFWSSFDDTKDTPFMIQIVTTVLGPTPFLAAIFIIFGAIVRIMGQGYSRLTPRYYSLIFVSCDVISLVVQGAGGGIAASGDTLEDANMGGNIMLGGIVFQLVVMTLFLGLAGEFFYRFFTDSPIAGRAFARVETEDSHVTLTNSGYKLSSKMRVMLVALFSITAFLYIRAIYRTIELAGGWHGVIIETEIWFNIFDGAMVVLAFYTMNFAHPGRLLGRDAMNSKNTRTVGKSNQLEMGSTGSLLEATRDQPFSAPNHTYSGGQY
ncbi:RTA1 like protein-domain-containing protein [Mucidula mucida]|nr:RTA1 like protein-domain-containing protein [Mucidula mucida]